MTALPAIVLNGRLDLLAANRLGVALYSPVYADASRPVNLARFAFLNPQATALYPNWDDAANTTVAMLRTEAGRNPYDRGLSDLIGELSTKRNLPQSLGHPQRAPAPGRCQTIPSPRRGRPPPRLRGHGTLGRHRSDPHRLQPRTRQPIPGRTGPSRQLGRHLGSERPAQDGPPSRSTRSLAAQSKPTARITGLPEPGEGLPRCRRSIRPRDGVTADYCSDSPGQ